MRMAATIEPKARGAVACALRGRKCGSTSVISFLLIIILILAAQPSGLHSCKRINGNVDQGLYRIFKFCVFIICRRYLTYLLRRPNQTSKSSPALLAHFNLVLEQHSTPSCLCSPPECYMYAFSLSIPLVNARN